MMHLRTAFFFAVTAMLSSCDPIGLGYANKLPYPVTVVEHGSKLAAPPIRLAAGETYQPTIGVTPDSIDVLDSRGHLMGHYRIRDILRQHARGDGYVVITSSGPKLEFSDRATNAQ
jgi:hypothetical protein